MYNIIVLSDSAITSIAAEFMIAEEDACDYLNDRPSGELCWDSPRMDDEKSGLWFRLFTAGLQLNGKEDSRVSGHIYVYSVARKPDTAQYLRQIEKAEPLEGDWRFMDVADAGGMMRRMPYDYLEPIRLQAKERLAAEITQNDFSAYYERYWLSHDRYTDVLLEEVERLKHDSLAEITQAKLFEDGTLCLCLEQNKKVYKAGDRVSAQRDEQTKRAKTIGTVLECVPQYNELFIAPEDNISVETVDTLIGMELFINDIGTRTQVNRQKDALVRLHSKRSTNTLLHEFFPTVERLSEEIPDYREVLSKYYHTTLTQGQKNAINGALNAPNLFLIQGPPGTGKTTVIAEIIRQLTAQNEKILLSAEANLAVDNVLTRIGDEPGIQAIRIGDEEKVKLNCGKYLLHKRADHLIQDIKCKCNEYGRIENLLLSDRPAFNTQRAKIISDVAKYKEYALWLNCHNDAKATLQQRELDAEGCEKRLDTARRKIAQFVLRCDSDVGYSSRVAIYKRAITIEDTIGKPFEEIRVFLLRCREKGLKLLPSIKEKKDELKYLTDEANSLDSVKNNNLTAIIEIERRSASLISELKTLDAVKRSIMQFLPAEIATSTQSAYKYCLLTLALIEEMEHDTCLDNEYIEYKEIANLERELPETEEDAAIARRALAEIKEVIAGLETKIHSYLQCASVTKPADCESLEREISQYNWIEQNTSRISVIGAIRSQWLERLNQRGNAEIFEDAYITVANVVCATCSKIADSRNEVFASMDYDCVIIDEAAKLTAMALLVPMVRGKKIILVGDHKQLPPFIEDKILTDLESSLTEDGYTGNLNDITESPFKMIFDQELFKQKTMLDTQFRMHPSISKYISECFYEGQLKDAPNVIGKEHGLDEWLPGATNVYWIDTPDTALHEMSGTSRRNQYEAEIIIKVLKKIDSQLKESRDIGIIAPYTAQRSLINKLLGATSFQMLEDIEVDTVDAFQGREKRIIIFSLVSNGPDGTSAGFMRVPSRMNVAFSRAEELLIIVGNRSFARRVGRMRGFKDGQNLWGMLDMNAKRITSIV